MMSRHKAKIATQQYLHNLQNPLVAYQAVCVIASGQILGGPKHPKWKGTWQTRGSAKPSYLDPDHVTHLDDTCWKFVFLFDKSFERLERPCAACQRLVSLVRRWVPEVKLGWEPAHQGAGRESNVNCFSRAEPRAAPQVSTQGSSTWVLVTRAS